MKNIEKQKESFHAENAKMHEFNKIINEFLTEDKKIQVREMRMKIIVKEAKIKHIELQCDSSQ